VQNKGVLQLFQVACEVINLMWQLDLAVDFPAYSDQVTLRVMTLAAHSILRIVRSRVRDQIDLQAAEEAYFRVIRMTRKRSIVNDDLDSKSSLMLTQLWSSKKIFHTANSPVDSLQLMRRSRLVSPSLCSVGFHLS